MHINPGAVDIACGYKMAMICWPVHWLWARKRQAGKRHTREGLNRTLCSECRRRVDFLELLVSSVSTWYSRPQEPARKLYNKHNQSPSVSTVIALVSLKYVVNMITIKPIPFFSLLWSQLSDFGHVFRWFCAYWFGGSMPKYGREVDST